ncbi:MAG: hypothetical protein JXB03_12050 [Spirochaetales bacterium]|nr:hypothetical protein [Spirochaetales bacterium]
MNTLRITIGFILTFIIFSCATKEPAPEPGIEPRAELPDLPRVLLPVQAVYAVSSENGSFDRDFIAMQFDRRDTYSVLPSRLVLHPGCTTYIDPVTTLGRKGIQRVDTIIVRTTRGRFALSENGSPSGDFDIQSAHKQSVPEFIVFTSMTDTPLIIGKDDIKNHRKGIRKGLEDLTIEANERIRNLLPAEGVAQLSRLFSQSRVFSDYEGIHSVIIIPHKTMILPDYRNGLALGIDPGRGFDMAVWQTFREWQFEFSTSKKSVTDLAKVTLGDMGVFSGGTALLEPDLVTHTRRLSSTANLVAMPALTRRAPSVITMAGSFNIYRDERNRYLWYPGIISYIPGNHPDISDNDVQIIFNSGRRELDAFLMETREVYFGTQVLPGGLPLFFLAAPSARDLELAYERNEQVRSALKEFLNLSAHAIRLFD